MSILDSNIVKLITPNAESVLSQKVRISPRSIIQEYFFILSERLLRVPKSNSKAYSVIRKRPKGFNISQLVLTCPLGWLIFHFIIRALLVNPVGLLHFIVVHVHI